MWLCKTGRNAIVYRIMMLSLSRYKKFFVGPCMPYRSQYNFRLDMFSSPTYAVTEAMDKINVRWGEFVVTPALMMGMENIILDRISFGGVKDSQEIFQ